jgi:hypothetical protein
MSSSLCGAVLSTVSDGIKMGNRPAGGNCAEAVEKSEYFYKMFVGRSRRIDLKQVPKLSPIKRRSVQ